MEVQIISREIMKPATLEGMPHNDPKTFQVSLLDTVSPQAYIPIIFFYSMKEETDSHFNKQNPTTRLKLSLSKTLAHFPILTGKIKGNLIHCSNEDEVGALFVEAKVQKITMAKFLKNPNLQFLAQFLPFPLVPNEPLERTIQIGAQVSLFPCGGIAIGFSFFHKIIDGTTMSAFIQSWAAASNFEGTSKNLMCSGYQYSSSSLFPARQISADYNLISPKTPFVVPQGKSSTSRRFVFDAMAISNLKARAKSTRVLNPTSVEVVTCFIWKYAMKASQRRLLDGREQNFVDSKWRSTLIHIVNMRRRIQPLLPEREVGNIYWRSPTFYEASNTVTTLDDLESLLRQSLSKIDNYFLQKTMGDDGFDSLVSSFQQVNELYEKSYESYLFTSWRNMGFNEVNFGWGKPVWHACGAKMLNSILKNIIFLMDTTDGEGLEAWIVLDDETMNLLENDDEFLEFASPNPSISHWLESKDIPEGIKIDEYFFFFFHVSNFNKESYVLLYRFVW